jgi:general transcription factor 3C polypeptide 3 (transcription factor C subunit 4)
VSLDLRRAIQRKKRQVRKGGRVAGDQERDSVFKGFTSRDRRKKHVREADQEAEAYLSQGTSANESSDGGGGTAAGSDDDMPRPARRAFFEDADVVAELCTALLESGKVEEAAAVVGRVLALAPRSMDKARRDAFRLLRADAMCHRREFAGALKVLKPVVGRWAHSVGAWNLYCRVHGGLLSVRHMAKLLAPLRSRHRTSVPVMVLQGHAHAAAQAYGPALAEYSAALALVDEPLLYLLIGVTHINLAMHRRVADRHRAVLAGFAFLQEYEARRGCAQESGYNIGRAAQQLGLHHIAVAYYERSLAAPAPAPDLDLDLRREAAWNLALIYRSSGAEAAARSLLRRFCVV